MIDRYEFFEKYEVRPTVIYNLGAGQAFFNPKNDLVLKVLDRVKNEDTGFYEEITFFDGNETLVVDLAAHWEKGPNTPIKFCREGVMNLIRAVYAKAEEDYEALYLHGVEEIKIKKMPGENLKEFHARRLGMYKESVAECEELLGKLYIKYAKIKALWRETHDPKEIAPKVNDTPEHVTCIIDRLGLSRPNLPREDDIDYRTVKLSGNFKGLF